MLKQLTIKNFTVFSDVDLTLSPNLNVIVGENGTGKTHLLKLSYAVLAASSEAYRRTSITTPTKAWLQGRIAEKLMGVFLPEALGRLVRRQPGRARCDLAFGFKDCAWDIELGFATNSKSEVSISTMPTAWVNTSAAYLPTRELLTIFPNFIAVYEGHYLEFEETWRDTCVLLGALLQRGPREARIKELLAPLEKAMGGSIRLENNGRFYLFSPDGRMEMHLVAEGLRKLGMIARLIATGALLGNGCLFWDEPEANLNPRLIKSVAATIVELSAAGIQIFIATHSLFLLREIDILLSGTSTAQKVKPRFLGLHSGDSGVTIAQGDSSADIGDIASLDEELEQSDRYLNLGNS